VPLLPLLIRMLLGFIIALLPRALLKKIVRTVVNVENAEITTVWLKAKGLHQAQ
jgi:hypothetical protein